MSRSPTGESERPEPTDAALPRLVGRMDLVLLVIGGVIGSGIFLVPGGVLSAVGGTVGTALLAWVAGGILALLGALTYAELGAMMPGTGGLYVYVRDAFGPFPAFLFGWTQFVAIGAGTVATLAVATSSYLGQFLALSPAMAKVVAVLVVAALTALNVRGTRISIRVLDWATVLKTGALALLIVILPLLGRGLHGVAWWPAAPDWSLVPAIGLAMVSVLWAYEGWQYATYVAGEVVDPQRNFPAGIFLGTAALVVIYTLANLGYVAALGPVRVAASERVASEAVAATLGQSAATAVAVVIIISMVSAAHMTVLTASRIYFAMARDRVFFQRLGRVHPRYGTPAAAVTGGGILAGVLCLLGSFQELLSYVVFVGWIFYGLGGLSLFVFRRRLPRAPRPFRVPGYPVTPLLFVASALAIVINAIATQPVDRTVFGLGSVLAGVPAYLLWRRRQVTT